VPDFAGYRAGYLDAVADGWLVELTLAGPVEVPVYSRLTHDGQMPVDDLTAEEDDDDDDSPQPTGDERDRAGHERDRAAEGRGRAAETRDENAQDRDDRPEARDKTVGRVNSAAAADRAGARQDRLSAAADRASAAGDREIAYSDRVSSAGERAISSFDKLTGVYRRDSGVVELERDIAKAKRTRQHFVLAFVDIDGLKATNDALGHPAGDRLLRQVADTLRGHLRAYDLVVRFGGDEFVCGLLDARMQDAVTRIELVNCDLAETGASVTAGYAELAADDSLAALVTRADEAMYKQRIGRSSARD